MVMARWEVWTEQEREVGEEGGLREMMVEGPTTGEEKWADGRRVWEEVQETTYSHASSDLIAARKVICEYSLNQSRHRLEVERRRRRGMVRWTRQKKRARLFHQVEDEDEDGMFGDESIKADSEMVKCLDETCEKSYETIRSQALEGSQYGDVRPLSAVCTSTGAYAVNGMDSLASSAMTLPTIIATGGWSGGIKIWNGGNDLTNTENDSNGNINSEELAPLDLLGAKSVVHEDRIMGIAMQPYITSGVSRNGYMTMVASASIDLTAKLCKVTLNEDSSNQDSMDLDDAGNNEKKTNSKKQTDESMRYNILECAHLKGHAARLCSVAFHPTGKYVATTSFDHTWRLWDVETSNMTEGKELLLQDGHAREVYGVGFHPDGSLVATTDFGGVVQCWDLRTGKSACHFLGHAKRVICSEFSPNGFQLATAGDDGTIKIWDLRRRRPSASIPAHTNIITELKFAHSSSSQSGEFLASSSFDGTGKIWSTRDWKLLSTLQGHEGKVMGIDILDSDSCSVVTCGYDKTLKLWK